MIRDRIARDESPVEVVVDEDSQTGADEVLNSPSDSEFVLVDERPDAVAEDADTPQAAEDIAPSTDAVAEDSGRTNDDVRAVPDQDVTRPNRRMAALFFIRVTDDGRTFAQRVVRPVAYDQSPLTETIRALIAGPTGEELDEGLLNLIPTETQLISAHVDNGIAYLNFNQAFRFNPMGAEGTVAQLQQIIYSSTEFPTVTRVQFLIDGERIDYVGGDGIFIGEPLGRDAFS